jgi:hypothetical protein
MVWILMKVTKCLRIKRKRCLDGTEEEAHEERMHEIVQSFPIPTSAYLTLASPVGVTHALTFSLTSGKCVRTAISRVPFSRDIPVF